ncbi:hypothetical protein AWB78_07357 [Caballeronia calidae]|uniref:Transmembrane protein n=1 Tax=Caballeronia calidae TaxID=1777139 RepID=A0A158EEA6_9BURK|nr:hypothetical protein [Caballeronia calidae]SAL05205.1 hypothetical protein AWB78_07357 [Caballeronia calidae]
MKTEKYELLVVMLFVDAYAIVAAIFAWHCWHHERTLGLQFWSLMFPLSFYMTGRMIGECRALILPPLLCIAWLVAVGVAPLYLSLSAVRATWHCAQAWRRRAPRATNVLPRPYVPVQGTRAQAPARRYDEPRW